MDHGKSGKVTWSDFYQALFDDSIVNMKSMWQVFNFLDSDMTGILTHNSLKLAFKRRGHQFKNES